VGWAVAYGPTPKLREEWATFCYRHHRPPPHAPPNPNPRTICKKVMDKVMAMEGPQITPGGTEKFMTSKRQSKIKGLVDQYAHQHGKKPKQ